MSVVACLSGGEEIRMKTEIGLSYVGCMSPLTLVMQEMLHIEILANLRERLRLLISPSKPPLILTHETASSLGCLSQVGEDGLVIKAGVGDGVATDLTDKEWRFSVAYILS
ncbi:hypothetical protein Tco_0694926 [Tanacetum coccineum]